MQLLKPELVDLKMTTVVEAVNIPSVSQLIEDGDLHASEAIVHAAQTMLAELQHMEAVRRPLRAAERDSQPAHCG